MEKSRISTMNEGKTGGAHSYEHAGSASTAMPSDKGYESSGSVDVTKDYNTNTFNGTKAKMPC